MPLPDFSKIPRRNILIAVVFLVVVVGGGLVWLNLTPQSTQPVTLTMWGTEPEETWSGVIKTYEEKKKAERQKITIEYTELPEHSYVETLTNALAAGTGPDIVMVGNRDLGKEYAKLTTIPPDFFPLADLRRLFPTIVEQEFADANGNIYALPISIDTLALFYNRNLFDAARIIAPPANWDEFRDIAIRLRKVSGGKFVQEGAAIGGTRASVPYATDILELLLVQNGTPMIDSQGTVRLLGSGQEGLNAFNFYLSFAQPNAANYTWTNDDMSLDAFAAGRVGMMFGYASDIARVRAKSPFLLFGVAPAPQALGASFAISTARYRGLAVTRQSSIARSAWEFIVYVTTDQNVGISYALAAEAPPALRPLIAQYAQDPNVGTFGSQALTARSWGAPGDKEVVTILDAAIESALSGTLTPYRALRGAEEKVGALLR